MVINILGVKRSAGKTENGATYSGWKCFFSYQALDTNVNGHEVGDKFLSDTLLNGLVPQPGDKFEMVYNFEGRIMSLKPIIEPKGNNYSQPASK